MSDISAQSLATRSIQRSEHFNLAGSTSLQLLGKQRQPQRTSMTQYPCPVCSYPLLRHIRSGRLYWFCHHCFQEAPAVEAVASCELRSAPAAQHLPLDKVVQPQTERALKWFDPDQPTLEGPVHRHQPPLVTQMPSTQTPSMQTPSTQALAIAPQAAASSPAQYHQEPSRYRNEIQRFCDDRDRKRSPIATQFSALPEVYLRVSLIEISSLGDVELSKTIHRQSK